MKSNHKRIAVVGLGQIGGSLASALHGAGASDDPLRGGSVSVIGYDRDPELTAEALRLGRIDDDGGSPSGCAEGADVLVLAVPVQEIVRLIPEVTQSMPRGSVLLDTGSTKRSVIAVMNRSAGDVRCFGGHPIAGNENHGPGSWDARLFTGKTFIVTRTASSDAASQRDIEWLVTSIGADIRYMDATLHDKTLAITSHLPLLLASGLVETVGHRLPEVERLSDLIGGSFSSATRVTQKPPAMIADILITNRDQLLEAYDAFDHDVRQLLAVAGQDPDGLVSTLSTLREMRGRIAPGGES